MHTFYKLLAIALVVITSNYFVWFALTYWAYLTTESVISTSFMAGIFLVITAAAGLWFGSIVDHHRKKLAMLASSAATLILFAIGLAIFLTTPISAFESITSVRLWLFIVLLLCGTILGNIYAIAIPTLIAFIVPEDRRDRANGMYGTMHGVAFGLTSVISGVSLAFGGMAFVLVAAIIATILAVIVLVLLVPIPERTPIHTAEEQSTKGRIDVAGTFRAVRAVPGLFALIFFSAFNNLLGGVFFALMDAYGLSLMSVENWGFLWGVLSLGFIAGGLYISRKGLGEKPLSILFRNNIITWTVCIFFTIQPSIALLAVGTLVWMFFVPFTEAIEQTIFQKVVPPERLGRVFGFAQAVEQGASPITAFLIGPITQLIFIPFMTTGAGVTLLGDWYGTGPGRGIALVFSLAGIVGLIVTLIAMRSRAYELLSARFAERGTARVAAAVP
jgi:DHA3 family multidrug efflux protein-like MFS transporter